MLERTTQTAAFWRDRFEITPADLDHIYAKILDAQLSLTTEQLALSVIEEYLRRESAHMEMELAKGQIYQPKDVYEVNQALVFPALDFQVGTITGLRAGRNPEHGPFSVITVKFDENDEEKEFAAGLGSPHRLNQNNGSGLMDEASLLSAAEIFSLYRDDTLDSLLFALEEGERAEEFVQVSGRWLLADMLAEVHVGHLNIAEALVEMAAKPISIQKMLSDLDLETDVSPTMQVISMEHALRQDGRFDQLGTSSAPLWYLRRLEPIEALEVPNILRHRPLRYNRALLSVELLQLEWELDDEWGESGLSSAVPSMVPSTSLSLTYPHRRAGTLPLNGRTRSFFPAGESGRSMVTLIGGRFGNRMAGWVVHEGRYVCGLGGWMEEHGIPVGAHITLERTNVPGEILVDFRPRRPKREWARFASLDGDGSLTFTMNKVQIGCEYDENLIVTEEDPETMDRLRAHLADGSMSLEEMVEIVVLGLISLNPAGNVHAKTVYSGVNLLRRCAPGPIFHALISNRKFQDLGGGLFALN
ncbi:MAG: hypothetical protein KBG20_11960 [Caldilineaceae bacterium]|nr:hypothetical protein [Caldilineaceae bacterium]MBP8107940.1 hypothetical protein [Caldilineaceae bacterium]MBP8122992.1 hypothetical protein [Caldilineaceae bacterium]MBP9073013.1 hypothetical protein [Caldilineaceae bacterium]